MNPKEMKRSLLLDAIEHQAMRRGLDTKWSSESPSWRFGNVALMLNKKSMGLLEPRIKQGVRKKGTTFVLVHLVGKGGLRTSSLFEALEYIAEHEPWVASYLADPRNTTFCGNINLLEDE